VFLNKAINGTKVVNTKFNIRHSQQSKPKRLDLKQKNQCWNLLKSMNTKTTIKSNKEFTTQVSTKKPKMFNDLKAINMMQ
jgi:hypothetical protein